MAEAPRANRPARELARRLRLIAVTPDGMAMPELVARSLAATAGGATAIWLRDRSRHPRELLQVARKLRETLPASALLIVSDRLEIAELSRADALQLGSRVLSPAELEPVVPAGLLVGYSAHLPLEREKQAIAASDYVVLGPVFDTPKSAGSPPPIGVESLAAAAQSVDAPLIAIGGIEAGNVARLASLKGLAGIAVIRAIFAAPDAAQAAAELRSALQVGE